MHRGRGITQLGTLQLRLQLLHLFAHLFKVFRQCLLGKREHLRLFFLDVVFNVVHQLVELGVEPIVLRSHLPQFG